LNQLEIDNAVVSHDTYTDEARVRSIFSQLRAEDPVHWTQPTDYQPFWTVTRHADLTQVGKRNDVFINEPNTFVMSDDEAARMVAETQGTKRYTRMLVHMDGQDHRAHRGIAQSWFMPANLKRLDATVEALALELIDKMERQDCQSEFVMDIAVWYPLRVIMTLLGVPQSDHPHLLKLTQRIVAPADPSLLKEGQDAKAYKGPATREFMEYFGKLYEERRQNPTDDLASLLANAKIDGEDVGRFEVLSYFIILATAGHDTTSSSLSGGLLALIESPTEMARLRSEPALMTSAVDEMFRWVTPVKHFMRTAVDDCEVGGKLIKAGERLLLSYPSANQDELIFETPEEFRVDRSPNRHVAFGFGAHACLGQNLARLELRIFFKHLLARFEDFELVSTPTYMRTNMVGGLKEMRLRYRTAAPK
jgi:cytochrome P450